MALVHSADENKGDVLDYVEKLDEMQREKLDLIESLRKVRNHNCVYLMQLLIHWECIVVLFM